MHCVGQSIMSCETEASALPTSKGLRGRLTFKLRDRATSTCSDESGRPKVLEILNSLIYMFLSQISSLHSVPTGS